MRDTIRSYGLIKKDDLVVVGVSGGPDSVFLLYALNALRKELGNGLHIAHLDHGLRKDSAVDREYVANLGRKLGIPVTSKRIDIRALAKKGSPEEAARNSRLDFLCRVARNFRADKVALGHNFDDQAETVLMRIIKGTGLYGLSGIMPKRELFGTTFIRPLIEIRRREIEAFLRRRGISPRIDETNAQEVFLRNKIRRRLLPLLEKEYNKNIREALVNLSQSAGCDYDYLDKQAERYTGIFGRRINLTRYFKLHRCVQRLILRKTIACLKGDTRRITFKHVREIEDMLLNRPDGSIVNLPQGVQAKKAKKYLQFYRAN